MKSIKFIPALALVAMLAACGGSKVSVKAPKFAKEGKEVEFAEFAEKFNDDSIFGKLSEESINKDGFPSLSIKTKYSSEIGNKVTEGKDVKSEELEKAVEEINFKADMKNLRLSVENSKKTEKTGKDYTGAKLSEKASVDAAYAYQYNTKDSKVFLNYIDVKNETYMSVEDMTDATEEQRKEYLSEGALYYVSDYTIHDWFYDTIYNFESWSEDEQARNKFYLNGNIFTIKYVYDETYEEKDSSDEVVFVQHTVENLTMQLDLSKADNFAYRQSDEYSVTVDFKQDAEWDGNEYLAGQKLDLVENSFIDSNLLIKDITLKEVDLSNFICMDDFSLI